MGKTQVKKPKSNKEIKKELEARLFGEKDKKKKKEIQGMIKRIDMDIEKERKEKEKLDQSKKPVIRQLIPVGVDPKTVFCLNFKNKNCSLGDKCQFSHEPPKKVEKAMEENEQASKLVCKFLIDALNNREFSPNWTCPVPNCKDIHKLTEMDGELEMNLEEFLEFQRQALKTEGLTPVTEETFKVWKQKKLKEEELHAKRKAALLEKGAMSLEMLKNRPDLFEDAEEGDEIDYHAREETDEESSEE